MLSKLFSSHSILAYLTVVLIKVLCTLAEGLIQNL